MFCAFITIHATTCQHFSSQILEQTGSQNTVSLASSQIDQSNNFTQVIGLM